MTHHINGQSFLGLLEYGLANLSAHRDHINSLNVFPVPDGDTGTNMVLTLSCGLEAAKKEDGSLSACAKSFASSVVFGARGNSGVILSQFFRGFCESLSETELASPADICAALDRGVELAYLAVTSPVEGTMLTVVRETARDAAELTAARPDVSVGELFDQLLSASRASLSRTPELLPILRSAGVVDSGGEGIVRIFEGMVKYLAGEELETVESPAPAPSQEIDFSRFNENSSFDYGYCTELLIQFTRGKIPFDPRSFNLELEVLGDSIVTALQGDKLKVHVHSFSPEKVLSLCHSYGEFLSLKIENMSVQHDSRPTNTSSDFRGGPFAVVTVAHTPAMAERFADFGSDGVLRAERGCPPAASDFINAFERVPAPHIFVFPNSKNAIPVARQAAGLFTASEVHVFDTVSDTQCYAALPMLDFSQTDPDTVIETVNETVENIITVNVHRASRDVTLNDRRVEKNQFAAMSGSKLLGVGETAVLAAADAAKTLCGEYSVARIFADASVSEDELEFLADALTGGDPFIETEPIRANDSATPIILSLE